LSDVTQNTDFFQVYPTWAVRVSTTADPGPGTGSLPPRRKSDVNTQMIPRRVLITSGSQQLDFAEIEWVYDGQLVDRAQPERFAKYCEVLFPSSGTTTTVNPDGSTRTLSSNLRVLDGDYVTEAESVGKNGERLTGQIQRREYHFGASVSKVPFVWDRDAPKKFEVEGADLVFNPTIDGTVRPNRSDSYVPDLAYPAIWYGWTHPEWGDADSSTNADDPRVQTVLKVKPVRWTLAEAVWSVCWLCNFQEEFILNPTDTVMRATLADAPPIQDIVLQAGQYLPYYLDRLLHPVGYNWCVDSHIGVQSETETEIIYFKPQIRIFKKGVGPLRQLNHQRNGETWRQSLNNLTSSEKWSDVNEYSLERRIGDSYSRVIVWGDYIRSEVTEELYPAWGDAYDDLTVVELNSTDGTKRTLRPTVHRLWKAGEDLSIRGLRGDVYEEKARSYTGSLGSWGTEAHPLCFAHVYWYGLTDDPSVYEVINAEDGAADSKLHFPLVAEPPLVFESGNNETPVRYSQPILEVSKDGGLTWELVKESVELLESAFGVFFNGDDPPTASGSDSGWASLFKETVTRDGIKYPKLRLRMTGVVQSPFRLRNSLESQTGGVPVTGREHTLELFLPDKFKLWRVLRAPSDMVNGIDGSVSLGVGGSPARLFESLWIKDTETSYLIDDDRNGIGSKHQTEPNVPGGDPGQPVYDNRPKDERDDRVLINDYARKILQQSINAEYDFDCRIPGWCTDWKIGDLIEKINGRNISLNQSVDPGNPAYCQVTGIEYTLDETEGPMTTLIVDRGTRIVTEPQTSYVPKRGVDKGVVYG
jgi:hypothetical protein